MDEFSQSRGTQVVSRVAAVLRAVSSSMPTGKGTTQVARECAISRPTAHRILAGLAKEGFIDRDRTTGNWLLGPELYLMGAIAADRFDVTEAARDHVTALASSTGESAFFSARRGNETVCLLRVEGSFPIRSFVLYEGKRFPLGVASAGLAILSFLPTDVTETVLHELPLEDQFGPSHSRSAIRERIALTRASGYALHPGLVVEGSWGMGAAVFDKHGQPAWALSVTGIEARFSGERQARIGGLLLEHAHQLSETISRGGMNSTIESSW